MKKIKIKISQEAAEEMADLKIRIGLAKPAERDSLIKYNLKEMECLYG